MIHYAALDVSMEPIVICVVDEEGRVTVERKVIDRPPSSGPVGMLVQSPHFRHFVADRLIRRPDCRLRNQRSYLSD
jgi:hypothetical protein